MGPETNILQLIKEPLFGNLFHPQKSMISYYMFLFGGSGRNLISLHPPLDLWMPNRQILSITAKYWEE